MTLKQQLQQDMRDAIRANDQQRVNVIRMVFAAIENTQEAMGKQAFASLNSDELNIQPDRHQVVSEQDIHNIILNEVEHRREAVELLRAGGQQKRAEIEETEIAILEHYLTKV